MRKALYLTLLFLLKLPYLDVESYSGLTAGEWNGSGFTTMAAGRAPDRRIGIVALSPSGDTLGYRMSGSIPNSVISPYYEEQEYHLLWGNVQGHLNAPAAVQWDTTKPTALLLYALPNGNTIEQTFGKRRRPEEDWHFDIQHIGAQTRYLRSLPLPYNLVTVYLATEERSWPAWKKRHRDYIERIQSVVDSLLILFRDHRPFLILSGHSGGGRFILSYLEAAPQIPSCVQRIGFLDSNYGYEDAVGEKLALWLQSSTPHVLTVMAYNDSVALYQGKPLVSERGGTWYRSRWMYRDLSRYFQFRAEEDSAFLRYFALKGRIQFLLKKNPNRGIYHTEQVERNGLIHSLLAGTELENCGYRYFGARVYDDWIHSDLPELPAPAIPPRSPQALGGSAFIAKVTSMSFTDREAAIYDELASGNMPDFLRRWVWLSFRGEDAAGKMHTCFIQVMPDYFAIGSDDDFCRMPMGPVTAQKLADLFGALLPTRKLVDLIYEKAVVKLAPVPYFPVGDANERPQQFLRHQCDIESQRLAVGGFFGELTAGIKKDVILSSKITDPARSHHVVIYGWHRLNGEPIQPVSNIHRDHYVDYSHGIRFMNRYFILDGEVADLLAVFKDPVLYKLVSDEKDLVGRY
ncbi:hypothetical protein JXO59_00355 [candidate division KSB1 bacterium]|nr:hypothetical protein [candidate division KSB1 bacterium]